MKKDKSTDSVEEIKICKERREKEKIIIEKETGTKRDKKIEEKKATFIIFNLI